MNELFSRKIIIEEVELFTSLIEKKVKFSLHMQQFSQ